MILKAAQELDLDFDIPHNSRAEKVLLLYDGQAVWGSGGRLTKGLMRITKTTRKSHLFTCE